MFQIGLIVHIKRIHSGCNSPNTELFWRMRIIALSTLKSFWEENSKYNDSRDQTLVWYRLALQADWSSPVEVKSDFGNASTFKDGRVVFSIAGNKYRLLVWINFAYRVIYIRFIGTHSQYDEIDVQNS